MRFIILTLGLLLTTPGYVSSDTTDVAHVRAVISGDGKDARLYAEFDLVSIRDSFTRRKRPEDVQLLVVTQGGWVVFDNRQLISTHRWSTSEESAAHFNRFKMSGRNVQQLLERQAAGELTFVGVDNQSEILVSQADILYIVGDTQPIAPGSRNEVMRARHYSLNQVTAFGDAL